MRVQVPGREARRGPAGGRRATQTENVRKMLLAFSRDLRVVMLRLASRLQTLRYHAASPAPVRSGHGPRVAAVFARWPTAWASGRSSGRWKTWRLLPRSPIPAIGGGAAAGRKAHEREAHEQLRRRLETGCRPGHPGQVRGARNIYSIVKDARQVAGFRPGVFDIRALRVSSPTSRTATPP